MTRRAPLLDDPPTAAACPRCGSAAFTRVKAKRMSGLMDDRDCKECGHRYAAIPAPMSNTAKTAMYASGVVLILGGVLALVVGFAAMQEPSPGRFSSMPLFGVFISVMSGFNCCAMPQRMQQLREKRLKEYQASAPSGAPPPVEIPATAGCGKSEHVVRDHCPGGAARLLAADGRGVRPRRRRVRNRRTLTGPPQRPDRDGPRHRRLHRMGVGIRLLLPPGMSRSQRNGSCGPRFRNEQLQTQ